jgi:hypothetical protein
VDVFIDITVLVSSVTLVTAVPVVLTVDNVVNELVAVLVVVLLYTQGYSSETDDNFLEA